MISFKQLRYALAVSKTLHFKKAADGCAVSQSTLSTAINELEKQLGFQIFERDNKKVLVTPLGKQVLEVAQNISMQVSELEQLSNVQKSPLSYPMSIGVIPTIGPYLLPKVLPSIREAYPDFRLSIIEDQSHNLVEMVRTGELDAAILAMPYPVEGLLSFEFWREDFYWVAHQSEDYAQQTEITSNELQHAHLMLLKDGHCLKEHALAACQLSKNEADDSFAATSLTTLIQMVAGKMGTTLVPHMALDQLLHGSSELNAVHLNEPSPHRSISFVIRPNYTRINSIELLMEKFEAQLEKWRANH